jgi:hypothetical protein
MAQYPMIQPNSDSNKILPLRMVDTLLAEEAVGVEGLFTAVALTMVVDTPVPSGFGATANE